MGSNILLSICIPTYGRLEILEKTLKSIYADLDDVILETFEVVVSDNDPCKSGLTVVSKLPYSNLKYFATECEGFLNSFYALKYGKVEFLKLHNNYTMIEKG